MNKTTLTIARGTIEIFDICEIVEEIAIPEGVTFIGAYAFSGCCSLIEIIIPNSVIEIGNGVFSGCLSLKSIYIDKEKDTLDLSKTNIPEKCKVLWRGEF